VVSLLVLSTSRLYPQEILLVLIYVGLRRPQGHSATGRIMSINKIQWYHRESNPRPFDFSASIKCATACSRIYWVHVQICRVDSAVKIACQCWNRMFGKDWNLVCFSYLCTP
jgi:hypothetical protein